uniref:hypothetical protein n=1 Tax=Salipiger pallidus TaxID=1775170 RepID=UPI001663BEB7|nr:hypothetical protein [Salipiger pallidus]
MAAAVAGCHMTAEHLRTAGLDRLQDLQLGQPDMPSIGPPSGGIMVTEDVGDPLPGLGHPIP